MNTKCKYVQLITFKALMKGRGPRVDSKYCFQIPTTEREEYYSLKIHMK